MAEISTLYADANGSKTALEIADSEAREKIGNLHSRIESKVLNFTASNNTSVNTSYKIIQSGNVCVANIYVTSLPTISTSDWLTVATMPVNAAQNVTFDAYLKSGSTTNDIEVRSGLITENKVRVYVGSDDTGKTFRAAIPFISL